MFSDHSQPLVPAETDGGGPESSSNSKRTPTTTPSDQASAQPYSHPSSLHPFFHPYSCVLQDNEGKYLGAKMQLIFPTNESLPVYMSIPDLEIHGLAHRAGDSGRAVETLRFIMKAQTTPLELAEEQKTD